MSTAIRELTSKKETTKYLKKSLEYLCERLGADKHTICLAPEKFLKSKKYSCTFEIPFSPEPYRRRVYLNYDIDEDDIILTTAINCFCQHIEQKFLPCGYNHFGFSDAQSHKYISPYEFAMIVHEYIQKYFFYVTSNVLKVDFEDLISLSEMFYESQASSGSIAFFPSALSWNDALKNISLKFNGDIQFSNENLNYIRKLLAGSGVYNTLLFTLDQTDTYICEGYIKNPNQSKSSIKQCLPCVVSFEGRSSMSVKMYDKTMFRVKNRQITCCQDTLKVYIADIYRTYKISHPSLKFEKIIYTISQQKHGTSILFIDKADKISAKHFQSLFDKNRAVATEHVASSTWKQPNNMSLAEIARIDGAMVMEISHSPKNSGSSIKYANVIVDVISVAPAYYQYGARHNAIICQMDKLLMANPDAKVAALIFSESGKVTYVKSSERQRIIKKYIGLDHSSTVSGTNSGKTLQDSSRSSNKKGYLTTV